jgi:hypothetical protein
MILRTFFCSSIQILPVICKISRTSRSMPKLAIFGQSGASQHRA